MERDDVQPALRQFLDLLSDLLAEKYFERVDERMKKIPELRRLITAKEASHYLSLSTETVYRMASQKKLPYLKIGDRVLFDVKALDHWIERHMIKEKHWESQELKIGPDKKSGTTPLDADFLDLLNKKTKG